MGRQIITRAGAELSVETGTASLLEVKHQAGKRNAEVFLRADHLERPIRGWLDTHDEDLRGRLEQARNAGGRLAYRIEVTRDKTVAAEVPWADVPQTSRFRRLVGIAAVDALAELVGDLTLASVGAAAPAAATSGGTVAESGRSQAPVAASRPAATEDAPAPPRAPAAAQSGAGPGNCVSCGEPIAGRPVKRTPRGYVHTDTACLEAPFTDPTPAPQLDPDKAEATARAHAAANGVELGDGKTVLEAGKEATAQRAAHRDAAAARAASDAVATSRDTPAGHYVCETCKTEQPDDTRADHEASAQHQGKARAAEQAAELAARRTKQIADAAQVDDGAAPVKPPTVPLPRPRGPRVAEGRPWEAFNSDGSVNMGSYAMQANTACVNWAQRLVIDRVRALAGETGEQAHIDPAQVRSLARTLLVASDRIQANIRDDGHVDRMDNSHTRSRSALSSALHVYPVPFGADDEVKAKWLDDATAWAVMLIRMAAELDR